MSKTKLDIINETIQSLRALGMPVSYELIEERDREERAISEQRAKDTIKSIEQKVKLAFSGTNQIIDIHIHYDKVNGVSIDHCVKNDSSSNKISLEREYHDLNVKYRQAIVVYPNGFIKQNELLYSQIDSSAICTLNYTDNEKLLLISDNGFFFGIPSVMIKKQPFGKLISPPQFRVKIINAFLCHGKEKLEVTLTDNSTQTIDVNYIFYEKCNSANGLCGPVKLTKDILSVREVY